MRSVEEQKMLVDAVRDTLEGEAPLDAVRAWVEAGEFDAFEKRFAAGGWYGVGLPEAGGGSGGDFVDVSLIAEELGRAASPSGAWTASAMAAPFLVGAPDLINTVVAGGGAALAIDAGAVPGDGSRPAVCMLNGRVSGQLQRVLAADRVRVLLVPAVSHDGPVVVAVDAGVAEVTVTPRAMLDQTRSMGDVQLNGAAARVVTLDDPASAVASIGAVAAVLAAADALGACQQMLDMTVAYTRQREQFGVPIASFQAVKHAAATMLVQIEPVRSIVRHAAEAIADGDSDALMRAAVAKTHASESAVRVAESALMLHGAIGFTWEHNLQLLYKRAKLDAQLFGTANDWRDRTADLLGLVPSADAGSDAVGAVASGAS